MIINLLLVFMYWVICGVRSEFCLIVFTVVGFGNLWFDVDVVEFFVILRFFFVGLVWVFFSFSWMKFICIVIFEYKFNVSRKFLCIFIKDYLR